MQKSILLNFFGMLLIVCTSCKSLKVSKFSVFNRFTYLKEQPQFNFQNDSLGITGAWNWASSARAIPKTSFIPPIPLKILKPIVRKNGRILFATWVPNRRKFGTQGNVQVTKQDVRFTDKSNKPLFIVVLINERRFEGDTAKYRPKGKNADYQFQLFATSPESPSPNYWVMEVIAAAKDRYFDFVCIMDESFVPDTKSREYQAQLFLDDIKTRFLTKE